MNIDPTLELFVPMLVQQGSEIREEAETNKRFHLGSKSYNYLATLGGHLPMTQLVLANSSAEAIAGDT